MKNVESNTGRGNVVGLVRGAGQEWKVKRHGAQWEGQPDWWRALPAGERTLLQAVAGMLRSAKRSQVQEVARAAAKWERGIGCFIKVRLMNARRRRQGTGIRNQETGGREQGSVDRNQGSGDRGQVTSNGRLV